VIAVVWRDWSRVSKQRFLRELSEANRKMASGLYQLAPQHLSMLTAKRPNEAEAVCQLGLCEEILGHLHSAEALRSRIPATSRVVYEASLACARVLMNASRFAPAETLLLSFPRDRGPEAEQANQALQVLYHLESRTAEIRELIQESGAQSVDPAIVLAPVFRDDAGPAGLRFVHDNGHSRRNTPPPEAMCGGVGLRDFDGDGRLDVYLVQGGPFPPRESVTSQVNRLFRNRGDGSFDDVTKCARITSFRGGYDPGVAVADYDNDGRPDVFVTRGRGYGLDGRDSTAVPLKGFRR
jgi:FG-GAP-like repeat